MVVVVVVVGLHSPVTGTTSIGYTAARRVRTLGGGILLLWITVPLLAVPGTGAGESLPVLGNAPPPLGGDTPADEGPPAAPGKSSTGDPAQSEDA